ncbi:MAG: hypothetical protein E4G90_09875 [Gemmatimonadales bacterium]|nr:MAG: hypothetical protein E4G90_09875 [Gemmatimonadales bacterium]
MIYEIIRTYNGSVGAYIRDDDGNMVGPLPFDGTHSPDGFEFGYGGSGPAELAKSILTAHLGKEPPSALYRQFLFDRIAALPRGIGRRARHRIMTEAIDDWLDEVEIWDEETDMVVPYRETEGAK